jgi:hypothetical protein
MDLAGCCVGAVDAIFFQVNDEELNAIVWEVMAISRSYYQELVLRSIEFYSLSLENISTGKSTDAISNVCAGHDSNRPLLPFAVPNQVCQ